MKKAFTFIELLVVSAILILISTSSVFYFFWFLDQSKLNIWINNIQDQLEELDNNVKNKDILDYEIFLKKDSLFLIEKENTLNLNNILIFSWSNLDFYTGSWELLLDPSWVEEQALKIDIYANNKFLENFVISWNSHIFYWFSKFQNYKILWTYSWQILNNLNIKYFSESNLDHKKQDYLKLIRIDTDKTNDLDSIYIKNILWRKSFSDNSNSTKLYLTFDVNWKEKTLIINK